MGPAFAEYTEKDDYKEDDYITDDGFWLYRKSRFNYYGVTALMARVYLYAEDKVNALTCAKEIIESGKFKLLTDQHLKMPELQRVVIGRTSNRCPPGSTFLLCMSMI